MTLVTTYGVGQYAAGSPSEAHTAGWRYDYKVSIGGRGLIWCHSAGSGSALNREPWDGGVAPRGVMDALASVLGPLISCDFGGNVTWGNSPTQSLITSAWSWLTGQYGALSDKVIVGGVSMGGINVLNWARANPTLVKGIILFYPAVALQAQYNGAGGAASVDIKPAYGGAEPNYATYDPSNGTNPTAYTGVPVYMAYSDSDAVVGTTNQATFAQAVGGTQLTRRVYQGAAHADMSQINTMELARWVQALG